MADVTNIDIPQTTITLDNPADLIVGDTYPERPADLTITVEFDNGVAVNISRDNQHIATARLTEWDVQIDAAGDSTELGDSPTALFDGDDIEYIRAATVAADALVYGATVDLLGGAALDGITKHLS